MSTLECQGPTALASAAQLPEVKQLDQGFSHIVEALFPQLHALNLEFLKLTAAGYRSIETHCGQMGLPSTVVDPLSSLSESGLLRMAQCPTALFDLAFDDIPRWTELCSTSEVFAADAAAINSRIVRFATSVLFFVWHSVQIDAMFSRFAFGTRDVTACQLKRLTIPELTRMAPQTAGWLAARWGNNPCFWPDLLRSCTASSPLQLQVTKLMGCQLLAAAACEWRRPANLGSRSSTRK